MTFGAPGFLWLLALLPLLSAVFFWNERRIQHLLGRLIAPRLRDALAATASPTRRRLRFLLLMIGLACLCVSLARPQHGYTWEQSRRKGRDVLIAIDTSRSMLANDLAPNRLVRAKLAVQDLMRLLPGDRVGLIAFAGTAFLQAPLTIDYSAVVSAVEELDTEIVPRGGTNIAQAIAVAAQAFGKGESEHRALILFTDGEELEKDAVRAARDQAANFRVFTVGVGTAEGSLIPVENERGGTSFVKDEQGQFVKSKLDETRLREIAEATGGFFLSLGSGPETMKQIVAEGLGKMQEHEIDARQSRKPIERYQWPLAAGLLLLIVSGFVSERRRAPRLRPAAKTVAALLLGLLLASPSFAKNSGLEAFDQGDYERAYKLFSDQLRWQPNSPELRYNLGTTAFHLQKDDEALRELGRATTNAEPPLRAKAETNLGHTLYRSGEKQPDRAAKLKAWREALDHYDESLKVETNDTVAGYREFVRRKIEELEKQQPPEKKDQQKQEDKQHKEEQQKKPDSQKDQSGKQQEKQQDDSGKNPEQTESKPDEQKGTGQEQKADQQSNPRDQQQPQPERENGQQSETQSAQQQDSSGEGDKERADQPAQQRGDQSRPGEKQEHASASPSPVPSQLDRKLSGEIASKEGEKSEGKVEEIAEAMQEAGHEGEMTERQAMMLLDSLRGEDDRVPLNERKKSAPVVKDW
jgi:Ca-activated chloride channel family protein